MNQLFQFDGKLYEQIDSMAMGSPLGPLMAHTFLCSIKEKLEQIKQAPWILQKVRGWHICYDETVPAAEDFLSTLNSCHAYINFTMELASNNKFPFIGMEVLKKGCKLETSVYRKPTNTGLLLHHQSHRHYIKASDAISSWFENHQPQKTKISVIYAPFIQNSNQMTSRLTVTTSFPRVFFHLV